MTTSLVTRWLMASSLLIGAAAFAPPTDPPVRAERRAVSINFRAVVGDRPFACGTQYDAIGVSKSTITPSELRLFVHDVRLVRRDGAEVPITLEQDATWQTGGLAMLDFEDGTGPCSNGSPATRTQISGTADAGEYTGVRFRLGVPFELNHQDLASLPAPLNVTRMFWSWNGGHKFMRFDVRTATGKSWVLHLGSTGCTPTGNARTPATACAQRNEAQIELRNFDPTQQQIVLDVAALYAQSDLENNQEGTAAGCMSAPNDRDCGPIFAALGLPFADTPAAAQRLFRVESVGAAARATR